MGTDPMNIGGPVVGLCKRNPPTLVVLGVNAQTGGVSAQGHWSPSTASDWCGQHAEGEQRQLAKPADPVEKKKRELKLL